MTKAGRGSKANSAVDQLSSDATVFLAVVQARMRLIRVDVLHLVLVGRVDEVVVLAEGSPGQAGVLCGHVQL